jgi:hypothetical protein
MMLAVAALLFQITPVAQVFTVDTAAQAPISASAPSSPSPRALFASSDVPATATVPVNAAPVHPAPQASAESPLHADNLDTSTEAETSLSAITVPEPPLGKPVHIDVESLPSRRKWLMLAIAEHGAAAFDAYATRDAISHGAHEDDPFLRPVANSNAIYAVSQISPLLLDYASHKMQRSENNFERHTWWVPQSLATAVYLVSGVHDLHVAH